MGTSPSHTSTPQGEVILYRTDDGLSEIALRAMGDSVWLTQNQIAELFDTTKQNISLHAANIYKDGEQSASTSVKEYLTVLPDGRRYKTKTYNLSMIRHRLPCALSPWSAIPPVGYPASGGVSGEGLRHERRTPQKPEGMGSF